MSERDPRIARVRLHDTTRGYALPANFKNSPPVVIWTHAGHRCRLLRLYRSTDAWLLVGDRGHVSLPEWLDRAGVDATVDQFRSGEVGAFNARKIGGHEKLLPRDIAQWPSGEFELGCRHGMTRHLLDDLATDAVEVQRTLKPLRRPAVPIE